MPVNAIDRGLVGYCGKNLTGDRRAAWDKMRVLAVSGRTVPDAEGLLRHFVMAFADSKMHGLVFREIIPKLFPVAFDEQQQS